MSRELKEPTLRQVTEWFKVLDDIGHTSMTEGVISSKISGPRTVTADEQVAMSTVNTSEIILSLYTKVLSSASSGILYKLGAICWDISEDEAKDLTVAQLQEGRDFFHPHAEKALSVLLGLQGGVSLARAETSD